MIPGALQRMLQARLQAAFSCWQERASELADKRTAAARAVAHLQDRQLWGAFSGWLEAAQQAQQAREHNSKALRFWTMRAAASAFAMWQPWAVERRLLRERLQGKLAWLWYYVMQGYHQVGISTCMLGL